MSLEDLDRINRHLDDLRHEQERALRTCRPEQIPSDLDYIDEAINSHVNFEPISEVGDIDTLLHVAANLAAYIRHHTSDS
ncbi:MAG: hypothetical protein QG628_709 [Patescibacteria group bacterium]|jgi:hypothetical protein|nr:hypothetical protein [Patescibacteria group bacterium]